MATNKLKNLACLVLYTVCAPIATNAIAKPLPYSETFTKHLEKVFKANGKASARKINSYKASVKKRKVEHYQNLYNYYRLEKNYSDQVAKKKASGKKEIRIYNKQFRGDVQVVLSNGTSDDLGITVGREFEVLDLATQRKMPYREQFELPKNMEMRKKKEADKIKDFDPLEGDSILIDKNIFDLNRKIKFKAVAGRKSANQAADGKRQFIYDSNKGRLYLNENSKEEGWGNGGLFAKLQGAPELSAENFTIV